MQRPAPLPVPPRAAPVEPAPARVVEEPSVEAADPVASDASRPSGASGTGPVSFDRDRPAPLPFAPREARAEETADDAEASARTEERPVGMRDVWRAARARRRALRAEVRRFTVRQRRRRMLWLGVAIAFVLLVVGTVGAAYSPLFAVRTIDVVGTTQLNADDLEEALSGQLGAPLALVDSSAVKAALVRFPLVESYTLEARPPNDLVVRIVERTPVGVIETSAGFTVVDAAGVALSTTPTAPEGQPLLSITGGVNSTAFRAAGQVVRSLPDSIRPLVTAVTATTPDDVSVTLGATNTQIVWGSAEDSAKKAVALQAAMISRPPDGVRLYDVSSYEAVVIG